MSEHKITVEKTARYFTLGEAGPQTQQVIFVCHGYAQIAHEFLDSFRTLASENTLILAPEGLHRFYTRGAAEKVVASWMTKESREDDIRDYVAFLDRVSEEIRKFVPEKTEFYLLGFSQGAATASRWASLGAEGKKFSRLILYCGFFPPDLPASGIPANIAITVVTASDDKFISPEQEKEQLETMRKISPQLNHIRFEGKHEIDEAVLKTIFSR